MAQVPIPILSIHTPVRHPNPASNPNPSHNSKMPKTQMFPFHEVHNTSPRRQPVGSVDWLPRCPYSSLGSTIVQACRHSIHVVYFMSVHNSIKIVTL